MEKGRKSLEIPRYHISNHIQYFKIRYIPFSLKQNKKAANTDICSFMPNYYWLVYQFYNWLNCTKRDWIEVKLDSIRVMTNDNDVYMYTCIATKISFIKQSIFKINSFTIVGKNLSV